MFEIVNETNEPLKEIAVIKELLLFAIKREKLKDVIFDVIIVDNKKIRKLNKEYRHIDEETDVISFALEDHKDITYEFRLLGDIYISLDKTKEQAKLYGHSFLRELAFLTIHGFLHLLGYDHLREEDEKEMFAKQEVILNEFGIKRENL